MAPASRGRPGRDRGRARPATSLSAAARGPGPGGVRPRPRGDDLLRRLARELPGHLVLEPRLRGADRALPPPGAEQPVSGTRPARHRPGGSRIPAAAEDLAKPRGLGPGGPGSRRGRRRARARGPAHGPNGDAGAVRDRARGLPAPAQHPRHEPRGHLPRPRPVAAGRAHADPVEGAAARGGPGRGVGPGRGRDRPHSASRLGAGHRQPAAAAGGVSLAGRAAGRDRGGGAAHHGGRRALPAALLRREHLHGAVHAALEEARERLRGRRARGPQDRARPGQAVPFRGVAGRVARQGRAIRRAARCVLRAQPDGADAPRPSRLRGGAARGRQVRRRRRPRARGPVRSARGSCGPGPRTASPAPGAAASRRPRAPSPGTASPARRRAGAP